MKKINVGSILLGIIFLCVAVSLYADSSGQYFKGNGGYGKITNTNFADLDYTKDFSLEAVVDINLSEENYEYKGILSKTHSYGMYNSVYAGWAFGLRKEGAGGAQIYVKVGDGTNQAQTCSPKYYLGRLHLIMVWSRDSRTVTLYVNGLQAAQQSNSSILLSNIKNNYDFWLARNWYILKSPIMYARIWNKDISGEVSMLYDHYNNTKQHELPKGFDKSELVSEWLMFEECDAYGNEGTTYVKDTVGFNHIQMLDSAGKITGKDIADIISSAGNLELVYPANGAIDQNKAVTLRVSGGYDNLVFQGAVKWPIQYYLQIDETNTFDSPNLKESDWIAEYPIWQPVLNPNKTYYWRVKVKDSSDLLESSYTSVYSFTTEGSTNWYVRPEGGNYGAENGTSYENAWDGLEKIVWGENGVEAGDTLYICGTHVRTVASNYGLTVQGGILPEASGTVDNPVVISGNYLSDPGIVWGAWKDARPGGMVPGDWQEVFSGVYYNMSADNYNSAYDSYGIYEDINGLEYKKYKKLNSSEDVVNFVEGGVYYMQEANKDLYKNRSEIWLRPFNPLTFRENIRWSSSGIAGWRFVLPMNNSYVEFRGLTIIAESLNHQLREDYAGPYHDFTFKDCKFFSWHNLFIYDPWTSYNITFDKCEFAYSGNGIYIHGNRAYIHHITIENSYFHDIARSYYPSASTDGQGVSLQDGENIYVRNNRFERCGSAICSDVIPKRGFPDSASCRHIYLMDNFIDDMRDDGVDHGGGIIITSHLSASKGTTEDLVIKNNIITNCVREGIGSSRKENIEIYNNVVQNCMDSYGLYNDNIDGASAKFFNNISLNPKPYHNIYNPDFLKDYPLHFYFRQLGDGYSTVYDFEADNNLYYPNADKDKAFHFYARGAASVGTNFAEWKKGHLSYYDIVDTHSLLSDPLFINHSGSYNQPEDFQLGWNSPVIDAGINVPDRTTDYIGNPIYGIPDIGAIEYQPPYQMGKDKPDINGDIRIYADGKFRNKKQPQGITADLAIMPESGFAEKDYARWMDVKIEQWGTGLKKWAEESEVIGAGVTNHRVGGLKPIANYLIKVNSMPGSGIADYPNGVVKSNSQGKVSFDYAGGYSQGVIFEIEETVEEPSIIKEDVDGDGDVDILDLQLCVNYVLSGEYNKNADVDTNGEVNVSDVQIVVNKVLGI